MGEDCTPVSASSSNRSSTVDPSKIRNLRAFRFPPLGHRGRMETPRELHFGKAPKAITHHDRPRLKMTHRSPGDAFTVEPRDAAQMHAHRSYVVCELNRGNKFAFSRFE